jgi:poly(3-hydroxybutyrate) depolymerase
MRCRTLSRALVPALALAVFLAGAARAADRLGSLPIDPAQISVSGISSGAFMANQLHVAHSAQLMGAGLVAGGLYGCAVFDATAAGVQPMTSLALGPCMTAPSLLQPATTYAERIRKFAALGWIDPVENLGRSRLYAFTGRSDAVVNPETVRRAVAVYGLLGLPTVATSFSNGAVNAGHSWVTQAYGVACADNKSPYINDCHYDQARYLLETIYGPLAPAAAKPTGRFVAFDQKEFTPAGNGPRHGLWDTGMLYVPAACEAAGASPCRLHVVLHGCKQSEQALGDRFYRNVGVNEWADTNRMVVLYPQARTVSTTAFNPPGISDGSNINPEGCWNWWGYAYDKRYLFKDGVQVGAIWSMVERVAGLKN